MLKRIPKSDISVRPFKAYKEWNFASGSTKVSVYEAVDGLYDSETTSSANGVAFNQNSLYGQLRAQFYNGQEDNPFLRNGFKTNVWTDVDAEKERYLSGSAKIISIPQKYIGDGIKPGSVSFTITDDNNESWTFTDDGFSNLIFKTSDIIDVSLLDFQTGQFNFTNYYTGTPYSTSVDQNTWNLESGDIRVTYQGIDYDTTIYSWDSNANPALMYVRNLPFLDSLFGALYMGNVFYNQGIITITRNPTGMLNQDWSLTYSSTETIYEHEYLLIANEDEFNISTNPTAIVVKNQVIEEFVDSNNVTRKVITTPGVKYVRRRSVLDNGDILDFSYTGSYNTAISGGFEQWEVSGSLDKTGSFLAPFITTIGLYDDDCSLVAVAKLGQPIKSLPDLPINFIVRFDT